MLNSQNTFIAYLDSIIKAIQNSSINPEILHGLDFEGQIDMIENAQLLVPVVGAFSAGKTTLLNSLLGECVLAVGITPVTSLATELRYSDNERIEIVKSNDTTETISIAEASLLKDKSNDIKFVRYFLCNSKLKEIQPLVLVDMPGFDSPLDLHNKAIMEYIAKGLHYVVLTSAEDGTLSRSMLREIQSLKAYNREFNYFLSKANLRSRSDVDEIIAQIENQVQNSLGISITVMPIGIDGGNNLQTVLAAIDPERLVVNAFTPLLRETYYSINERLNSAVSSFKRDRAGNEKFIAEMKNSLEALVRKKDENIAQIQEKYSNFNVNRIVDGVGRELSNSIEELKRAALHGKDSFSSVISEIVRCSLIEKVNDSMSKVSTSIVGEFSEVLADLDFDTSISNNPGMFDEITKKCKRLYESTASNWNTYLGNRNIAEGVTTLYKNFTTLLSVTTSVVTPLLEVVIIFLPDILRGFMDAQKKKEQQEKIHNEIIQNVIPKIKSKLRHELPKVLHTQITTLISSIHQEFDTRIRQEQDTIEKVEKEKAQNIIDLDTTIESYENLRKQITEFSENSLFERFEHNG